MPRDSIAREDLFRRMTTYSHSKIESFRQCPRKFFYNYIAKVELEEAA